MTFSCLRLAGLLTALLLLSCSSHGFNRKLMQDFPSADYEPSVLSQGSERDDYKDPEPNTNSQSVVPIAPAPAP
ncbi:hypothetical protein AgCh_038579 [Apium graveolens]